MQRIEEYLKSHGVSEETSELATYGICKIFLFIINIILFVIVGYIFHCSTDMCVFLVAYIPLRIYAGGFHFKKLAYCEALSLVMICFAAFVMRYLSEAGSNKILTYMSVAAVLVHYILAPQDNNNKRLFDAEKRRYKTATVVLITVYFTLTIFSFYKEFWRFRMAIILAMFLSALSLLENYIFESTR